MRRAAFSLVELLVAVAIIVVLSAVAAPTVWGAYKSSSLAVSANNLRQLAAGAAAYLGDNNYVFWKYREGVAGQGVRWWFGFEPTASISASEGSRTFDPLNGPLSGYVPAGFRPDPSFGFSGKPFKPKYKFGYIGVGYNVLLGGGWLGAEAPVRYWELQNPAKIVVFSTSAQVNTFQRPASARNPMIEEFYGIDDREVTVHFRHNGQAIVAFANGSAGFLPMDESTLDRRAPSAQVGRFAPRGSSKYLR